MFNAPEIPPGYTEPPNSPSNPLGGEAVGNDQSPLWLVGSIVGSWLFFSVCSSMRMK